MLLCDTIVAPGGEASICSGSTSAGGQAILDLLAWIAASPLSISPQNASHILPRSADGAYGALASLWSISATVTAAAACAFLSSLHRCSASRSQVA